MVDIAWVVFNAVCAILQAVYELFRPPPLKSVRLETALVSVFNLLLKNMRNMHFVLHAQVSFYLIVSELCK